MRGVALALILISISVAGAFAQSAPIAPSINVAARVADLTTVRQVQVSGLPAHEADVVLLFDPSGQETVMLSQSDASGSLGLSLQPPNGSWQVGMYRVAVGRPDGSAISATFVASDGQPHLFAAPNLPSPTSAFNFEGTGLPANQHLDLDLDLTGGQVGTRTIPVTTDADGTFSMYVWPQQLGLPFFAAGNYLVHLPSLNLSTPFTVREHPVSSTPEVSGPVIAGSELPVHFESYPRNVYVWGLYGDMTGHEAGEFVVGPVPDSGQTDARIPLPRLASGQYLLATPYQWGETGFSILQPTPTATVKAVPTATRAPVHRAPTATATPRKVTKYTKKQAAARAKALWCRKHVRYRACQSHPPKHH